METPAQREVYSVGRLNREARMLLEGGLPALWVEGEISNFSCPASGHWYFTLKDRDAQIRCAMFRTRNTLTGYLPRNGQQVLLRGRVSLYEPRGDYQLIAERMEDAGEGALRREFDRLKAKLAAEGLFEEAIKRPLPLMPRRIAVVTSPTGAAIRDVVHILARRFPPAAILIYPTPVQGAAATGSIVAAIDAVSARCECDVLILARGGGSIEDLWCFNDERVARAIRRCTVPVVTGIGHEIDFTIADFAADVRAPTPSGAAELVVPDRRALLSTVADFARRIERTLAIQLARSLEAHRQLAARMQRAHPGARLSQQAQHLDEVDSRLRSAWENWLQRSTSRLQLAQRGLQSVSPLATLERGYAIVTNAAGAAVIDATVLQEREELQLRFARGSATASVTSIRKDIEQGA
jgi:exodeoxyribonuclease VII large subunit